MCLDFGYACMLSLHYSLTTPGRLHEPDHNGSMTSYSIENFFDRLSLGDHLILKVDFVAKGEVTGVGFRRSVKATADAMQLRGWVAKATSNKVLGTVEGPYDDIQNFKSWLSLTGPKGATIEEVVYSDETWKPQYSLPEGKFNVVYKY